MSLPENGVNNMFQQYHHFMGHASMMIIHDYPITQWIWDIYAYLSIQTHPFPWQFLGLSWAIPSFWMKPTSLGPCCPDVPHDQDHAGNPPLVIYDG